MIGTALQYIKHLHEEIGVSWKMFMERSCFINQCHNVCVYSIWCCFILAICLFADMPDDGRVNKSDRRRRENDVRLQPRNQLSRHRIHVTPKCSNVSTHRRIICIYAFYANLFIMFIFRKWMHCIILVIPIGPWIKLYSFVRIPYGPALIFISCFIGY